MVTITQSPDLYTPSRSPTVFVVHSDNINRTGFSYVGHLFDADGNLIAAEKIDKRPSGYGIWDVGPILKNYIQHEADVHPGAVGFSAANSYFKTYSVSFGEKVDEWEFLDSFYSTAGRTGFSGTTPHGLSVGDKIIVKQTPPYLYNEWEGSQVCMDIPDPYSVTIDHGFQSGPTTPGVLLKDGQSFTVTGLTSSSAHTVAGFTLSREDFTSYDSSLYIPDASNPGCNILTNCPDGYRIASHAQMFIPIANNGHNRWLRITTLDRNGNTVGVYGVQSSLSSLSDPEVEFCFCGIGPANLSGVTHNTWVGSTTIFGPDVKSYRIGWMDSSTNNADPVINTRELHLVLDTRCAHYEEFDLLFADKMGAWVPVRFPWRSDEIHNVKKQLYGRAGYGEDTGNGSFIFRNQRRGYDVHSVEHLKSFVLRSEWLTDPESLYFMELKSSPYAFWVKDRTTFLPLIIDDEKTTRLKIGQESERIRYELSCSMGYRENTLI